MKKILCFLSVFMLMSSCVFAQEIIEGDRYLDLLEKPVTDPLFLQLKKQESFLTNSWDEDFTIYISVNQNRLIDAVEFENGKKKYNSEEKYGYYQKRLPMQLTWNMKSPDYITKFGKPVFESTTLNLKDFISGPVKITVYLEADRVVSLAFRKAVPSKIMNAPQVIPAFIKPPLPATGEPLLKYSQNTTTVSWPVLYRLLTSCNNMKPYTANDSVDYIGQIYYAAKNKAEGFERTAIKRKKQTGQWFYEAFLRTSADTPAVKKMFLSVYDAVKKVMSENADDDFINVAVAKDKISESPMNWMVAWTMKKNSQMLPGDTSKPRLLLMMSGMKNAFNKDRMEYVIKIYVHNAKLEYDFWNWDKPL